MVDWPRKASIPFVPERLVQSAFMSSTVETVSAKKQRVIRRRWGIAWLLGFGVLVNHFDRVNLSVSRDALQATFGISAVMFGYLSSAYSWTYAALQLPSGLLLDRFGVRRVGRISTFLWSAASLRLSSANRGASHAMHMLK